MTKEDFKKLAEKHLFILEGHTVNKEGIKEMQIFGFDTLYEQLPIHNVRKSVTVKDLKCPKCKKHNLMKYIDRKECTSCGYDY